MALNGSEYLYVVGRDNLGRSSGESLQTTTAAIAALGGGAGSGAVTPINTGTIYTTALSDTFVRWKTATTGAKTTTVRTFGMVDGQVTIIKDYGAGDYPQTVQPLEGGVTIEYASSYTFAPANGASVNLKWDATALNLVIW